MTGARAGHPSLLRRLIARATARDLTAFVVPGLRAARAGGIDPAAAGLRPVATPRHATVLLVVGELPDGLARAVAVVYAQMPRPRAILLAGGAPHRWLPAPDIRTSLDQQSLAEGVARLRIVLESSGWLPDPPSFEPPELDVTSTQAMAARGHGQSMHTRGHGVPQPAEPVVTPPDRAMHMDRGTTGHDPNHGHAALASAPPDGVHTSDEPESAAAHNTEGDGVGANADYAAHGSHAAPAARRPQDHHVQNAHHDTIRVGPQHDPPDRADGGRVNHAAMRHGTQRGPAEDDAGMDHSAMGHSRMDHSAVGGGEADIDHAGMDHAGTHAGESMDHAAMGHEPAGLGSDHGGIDHSAMDHATMNHTGMDHAAMDHSAHMMGGFMSMVAMTKDLPRSADGLPMEWLDTPYGPLFPGLPGGLELTLTLDGDGVARAALELGGTARGLDTAWQGPAVTFPDRLARLDPLAPVSYRVLALRGLAAAASGYARGQHGREPGWMGAIERERAASHFGWLADLLGQMGAEWMAGRCGQAQVALARATSAAEVARLAPEVTSVLRGIEHTPMLRRRLSGIGVLAADHAMARGPVARGGGAAVDARADDPDYRARGFAPCVAKGGDAYARLRVRLAEIEQSLDLVAQIGTLTVGPAVLPSRVSGVGIVSNETPRGAAFLHVEVVDGMVTAAHVDPPSRRHTALVPAVAEGLELADALVGITSLDLSPWEIAG